MCIMGSNPKSTNRKFVSLTFQWALSLRGRMEDTITGHWYRASILPFRSERALTNSLGSIDFKSFVPRWTSTRLGSFFSSFSMNDDAQATVPLAWTVTSISGNNRPKSTFFRFESMNTSNFRPEVRRSFMYASSSRDSLVGWGMEGVSGEAALQSSQDTQSVCRSGVGSTSCRRCGWEIGCTRCCCCC